MSKDNEKINANNKSVKKLPAILEGGYAYRKLISNRGVHFRKELFEMCNNILPNHETHGLWKMRFHYPELIPENNFEMTTKAMADALAFMLQKQVDFLIEQQQEPNQLIESCMEIINSYQNEQ